MDTIYELVSYNGVFCLVSIFQLYSLTAFKDIYLTISIFTTNSVIFWHLPSSSYMGAVTSALIMSSILESVLVAGNTSRTPWRADWRMVIGSHTELERSSCSFALVGSVAPRWLSWLRRWLIRLAVLSLSSALGAALGITLGVVLGIALVAAQLYSE